MFDPSCLHATEQLGRQAAREVVDAGEQRTMIHLWDHIHAVFKESRPELARVLYAEPALLRVGVDASYIPSLSALQLIGVWGKLRLRYRECRKNWKTSGRHSDDFWPFCRGRVSLYNLKSALTRPP
eukprot:GHVU01025877.1.p1 GENE.GHVU01025877.1~~GHVU01025877.1.p1  ORF type:complete len:126 (+),score=9.11 GHVU01025877.1:347-724(+)